MDRRRDDWSRRQVLSKDEMLAALEAHYGGEAMVGIRRRHRPSRLPDGTVNGIISSTTQPFRRRAIAAGWRTVFGSCVYTARAAWTSAAAANGVSDTVLQELISSVWRARTKSPGGSGARVRERSPLVQSVPRWDPHLEMPGSWP